MTNATAIAQTFTVAQSSAIAAIRVEDGLATITFQSNPSKSYDFTASDNFVEELESVLNQNPIQGLGSLVASARKTGDLVEVVA